MYYVAARVEARVALNLYNMLYILCVVYIFYPLSTSVYTPPLVSNSNKIWQSATDIIYYTVLLCCYPETVNCRYIVYYFYYITLYIAIYTHTWHIYIYVSVKNYFSISHIVFSMVELLNKIFYLYVIYR